MLFRSVSSFCSAHVMLTSSGKWSETEERKPTREKSEKMNLQGRNFLTLKDFTPEEIRYFLDTAKELKEKKKNHVPMKEFEGRNIALIFEKTSTRTRCSFEVAAHDLGMGVTYLDPSGSQIGKKESIADTARVLGRMFDGIEYRGFGQEIVEELAEYAEIGRASCRERV